MAAAEPQPTGMGFLGLLSFRRSPTAVVSLDPAHEDELLELDLFQAHVADRFMALSAHAPAPAQDQAQAQEKARVLSLAFLAKLMDAVLSADGCFRDLLAGAPAAAALGRAPADRLAAELLDRAVKALDVLNAASLALASLRGAHRAARGAAACLLGRPLHPAQLARARRAVGRLFPDPGAAGGGAATKGTPFARAGSHARALSFSVSKNWSAGRQVHAMAAHLAPPPPAGAAAGGGLGLALYTMSSVLVFAMWALVAAVPCQDRGSTATTPPVSPPKQLQWAAPMVALQERIGEEWRRKEKKGSPAGAASPAMTGLLAEMQAVKRAARSLMQFLDELAEAEEDDEAVGADRAREVGERAEELAAACRALEDGLGPLERQVRAVFHRVVASRTEVMLCVEHSARCAHANANAGAATTPGMPPHHSS